MLLRDDKSFPNILVTAKHDFPQLKKHRGTKKEKGNYYGPFASASAVNRTLNQLQRMFLLRDCTDSTFGSRTRPCLQFQIKRCSAPCVGKISPDSYRQTVKDAEDFLNGKTTAIQARLASEMSAASEELEFERAAALARPHQGADPSANRPRDQPAKRANEADVIAVHMEGGQACVQVFFIRGNQNWGNRDYYPRVGWRCLDATEVMQAFVGQFYDSKDPPRMLLLSHQIENADLVTEALSRQAWPQS